MAGLPPQVQVKVPVDKSKEDHGSDRGDENCGGKPRSHLRENPPKAQESAKEDKCGYSSGHAPATVIRQDHAPQRHGDVEGLPGERGREEETRGKGGKTDGLRVSEIFVETVVSPIELQSNNVPAQKDKYNRDHHQIALGEARNEDQQRLGVACQPHVVLH